MIKFSRGRPRKHVLMTWFKFRMLPRDYERQRMAAGLEGFETWSAWVRAVLEKATVDALAKAPQGDDQLDDTMRW